MNDRDSFTEEELLRLAGTKPEEMESSKNEVLRMMEESRRIQEEVSLPLMGEAAKMEVYWESHSDLELLEFFGRNIRKWPRPPRGPLPPAPPQALKLDRTGEGLLPKKLGRVCFTCRACVSSVSGATVECRYLKFPVWWAAACPKWRVTLNEKRLRQYDRFLWAKELWKMPKKGEGYYGKYNEVKSRDKVTIKLGRCCFTCRLRTERKGHFVMCQHIGNLVWERAQCPKWKKIIDLQQLAQFKKHLPRKPRQHA
jgi:hypothetical protein